MTPLRLSLLCLGYAMSAGTAFALPVAHNAAAPVYVDEATHLQFPAKLHHLDYKEKRTYGDPKLGFCILYASDKDNAQICIYDNGHKNLPTGITSSEFKQALDNAVNGTLRFTNKAPYYDGKIMLNARPSISNGNKIAVAELRTFSSRVRIAGQADAPNLHMVLMTTALGKFIKMNYSSEDPSTDGFAFRTRESVEAFGRFNGDTMKAFLVDQKK